jgi:hypothetical protein
VSYRDHGLGYVKKENMEETVKDVREEMMKEIEKCVKRSELTYSEEQFYKSIKQMRVDIDTELKVFDKFKA